jgi:hypothetical protein
MGALDRHGPARKENHMRDPARIAAAIDTVAAMR